MDTKELSRMLALVEEDRENGKIGITVEQLDEYLSSIIINDSDETYRNN